MEDDKKIECLIELSKLISLNKLKYDDIRIISEKFFSKYVDVLHIGKIEIISHSPKNIFDCQLVENRIVAYDGTDVSDEYIVKEIEINNINNGSTNILVYPIKGYYFKSEEIEFIFSIVSLFHLYFSKQKLENLIEETKYKDSLTNVLNMAGLNKFLHQIKNVDKYVYIFNNIKNFKYINSIFNRKDADEVLKKYAEKLASMLGSDEVFCRAGGDNFISVVKTENFKKYLKKLEHSVVEFNGRDIDLYSTVGYYENVDCLPVNNAVEFASTAYVIAKRKKLNVFKYTDELNKKIMDEKTIKVEIIDALKKEELVNYYQPKVDCYNNELYGAEALVRWKKDDRIVFPSEFIEILEKENMVINLDYYVLIKACKDIKKWQQLELEPIKISVNFSMKHLDYDNTIKEIIRIIKKFDVDPKYIEIELTELTNIENLPKMARFIKQLKKNNISVSMDDFGSGYSSITLLKNLNYDIVKIDKALVDCLETGNIKNLIILRNIVTMLKELQIDVVAEGVESKKQLDILKEFGCKIIQGFYYDRPLEDKEFVKRLEVRKYN